MITTFLSTVASLIFPKALADNIKTLGSGAPGIDQMWGIVKNTFPHTDEGSNGVPFLALMVADFILKIIGALAVLMIIYGGLKMIFTAEEGLNEAKKILLYAVLGLIAALCAQAAVTFAMQVINAASA